jgi:hypothetical protein
METAEKTKKQIGVCASDPVKALAREMRLVMILDSFFCESRLDKNSSW